MCSDTETAVLAPIVEKRPKGPDDLPNELFDHIMATGGFSQDQLWCMRAVSRGWRDKLVGNTTLWQHLDTSIFGRSHAEGVRRYVELFGDSVKFVEVKPTLLAQQREIVPVPAYGSQAETDLLAEIGKGCPNVLELSAAVENSLRIPLQHPERVTSLAVWALDTFADLRTLMQKYPNVESLKLELHRGIARHWYAQLGEIRCPKLKALDLSLDDLKGPESLVHRYLADFAPNMTSLSLSRIANWTSDEAVVLRFDRFVSLKKCTVQDVLGNFVIKDFPEILETLVIRDIMSSTRNGQPKVTATLPSGLKHFETNFEGQITDTGSSWLQSIKKATCQLKTLGLELGYGPNARPSKLRIQWVSNLLINLGKHGLLTELGDLTIRVRTDGLHDAMARTIITHCPALIKLTWFGSCVLRQDLVYGMIQKEGKRLKALYLGSRDSSVELSTNNRDVQFEVTEEIRKTAKDFGAVLSWAQEAERPRPFNRGRLVYRDQSPQVSVDS